jgi:hypothetical protein
MTDSTTLGRDLRAGAAAVRPRPAALAIETPSLSPSAVSWAAIFAGAAGAAALSLILLILGTGLGLSSVSPWSNRGASATTLGVSTIVWITFTQLAASGMGGYLAGRLRTRWASTHTDEVYFRDTAHGFLAWAIATLVTAGLLSSAIGSIVGSGANAAGAVAGGAGTAVVAAAGPAVTGTAKSNGSDGGNGYFVDRLFRQGVGPAGAAPAPAPAATGAADSGQSNAQSTAEAGRIFASALTAGALPADDVHYLGQMVSQKTGMSQADAEKRVNDEFTQMKAKADQAKVDAKQAADKARKASAYAALWLFISLLVGAFVASFAATFGGRQRDLV